MSQIRPRPAMRLLALLSSLAVAGIVAVALWTYLGGSGGDDPVTRRAVIAPVQEAVAAAQAHAQLCAQGFAGLTRDSGPTGAALDARMAELQDCGQGARRLAEAGYAALDTATGPDDSPLRAEFLDSAGALLSVYELQGDDFDVIHTLLQSARAADRPLPPLADDVGNVLDNAASDIAAAEAQFDRTLEAYRAGG